MQDMPHDSHKNWPSILGDAGRKTDESPHKENFTGKMHKGKPLCPL
jgi:hypothetical protein